MHEKASRSIAKTVSWRALGTLDTVAISWIITGSLGMAASIGMIELVTKMVLYYLHERAWSRIRFGLVAPTKHDYHI